MSPVDHPVVLRAIGLGIRVGVRALIEQASFSLRSGQWLCVCGPNGAGKSTLLRALAGLQPPHQGQIDLLGRPLAAWPAHERATRLTWMGQAQALPMDLTVRDVVQLGRWPHERGGRHMATEAPAVQEAIQTMGLRELLARGLNQVSGGEGQRALLARAMASGAQVMLFDEPLHHLDMPQQQAWLTWVRRHVAAGGAVATVMHELHQALAADQLLVMQGGRVLHQGAPDEAQTREALQEAFEHTLSFHRIDTQGTAPRWVVLPRPIS